MATGTKQGQDTTLNLKKGKQCISLTKIRSFTEPEPDVDVTDLQLLPDDSNNADSCFCEDAPATDTLTNNSIVLDHHVSQIVCDNSLYSTSDDECDNERRGNISSGNVKAAVKIDKPGHEQLSKNAEENSMEAVCNRDDKKDDDIHHPIAYIPGEDDKSSGTTDADEHCLETVKGNELEKEDTDKHPSNTTGEGCKNIIDNDERNVDIHCSDEEGIGTLNDSEAENKEKTEFCLNTTSEEDKINHDENSYDIFGSDDKSVNSGINFTMSSSKNTKEFISLDKSGIGVQKHQIRLGFYQFFALSCKNLLSKFRSPYSTFFEIFSPVAMCLILVAVWSLADEYYHKDRRYDRMLLQIPGPWLDLTVSGLNDARDKTGLLASNNTSVSYLFDALESFFGLNLEDYINFEEALKGVETHTVLSSVSKEIQNLLDNPLPIPTLDQYIAISLCLSTALSTVTSGQSLSREAVNILQISDYGRTWGNLLELGTLHISPTGVVTDSFVEYLNSTYPLSVNYSPLKIRTHKNQDLALEYICDNLHERTWALIDMGGSYNSPFTMGEFNAKENLKQVEFTIRMNYTTVPNTNRITDFFSVGLNRKYQRYYTSGFLTLQRTLEDFALHHARHVLSSSLSSTPLFKAKVKEMCTPPSNNRIWSIAMPTRRYSQNIFYKGVGYMLGLVIAMAFLFPMSRLVRSIVDEKESRMRETLQILGVKSWAYWLSWILVAYLIFALCAVFVTLTLTWSLLINSSMLYVFAFIFLFCSSVIGFSFFISSFFSRAKLAAIFGPVALFCSLLPRWLFYGTNQYEMATQKKIASLLPCTAFAFGADIIADYEYAKIGVHSYNSEEGDYSFNTCLAMMLFDTFLYMVLAWYFDAVVPRQFGVAKKWYYLCLPSYWRSCFSWCWCGRQSKRERKTRNTNINITHTRLNVEQGKKSRRDAFECVSSTLAPRVEINDLVKCYNKINGNAVDHLNLNLYENEITCLLGHNGAGKTTTISILTGLTSATSGECTIYDHPISTELAEARSSMGICPQHNVLFGELTVAEHLRLFERIKGVSPTKESISKHAKDVGLGDKLNTLSRALSGGMKRKLSVAIAFCGDPRFVILDEPTSGMDPYSRRATWDLLRRSKKNRVTLLTTHFMDEADVLSDRVAVMKSGKLQCFGTSPFLKKTFGLGYSLTIVSNLIGGPKSRQSVPGPSQEMTRIDADDDSLKVDSRSVKIDTEIATSKIKDKDPECVQVATQSRNINDMEVSLDPQASTCLTPYNQPALIKSFLQEYVSEAELIRQSARELTFRFPYGSENSFPFLFNAMEKGRMQEDLGVGTYGISNTSLEDVFLQLSDGDAHQQSEKEKISTNDETIGVSKPSLDPETQPKTKLFHSQVENEHDTCLKKTNVEGSEKMASPLHVAIDIDASFHIPPEEAGRRREVGPNTKVPELNYSQKEICPQSCAGETRNEQISVGIFEQVLILLRKRIAVQRRDHKVIFFMIFLPCLLIALALLVLTIKLPLAGPPIALSMDLYDNSSSANAKTDVMVGGTNFRFDDMTALLSTDYPHVDFKHFHGLATSAKMSSFLLRNHNDTNNLELFGAFVFDDTVRLLLRVDWNSIARVLDIDRLNSDIQNFLSPFFKAEEVAGGTAPDAENIRLVNLTRASSIVEEIISASMPQANTSNISDFFGKLENPLNLKQHEILETIESIESVSSNVDDLLSDKRYQYRKYIESESTIMHNSSSPHAIAAFNHANMQYHYKGCSAEVDAKFDIVNHPLPLTSQQNIEVRSILSIFASLFILIPFCFTPSAFIIFIVKERVCKSKHVQLVSGVNLSAFWMATYIWDLMMYSVLTLLVMVILTLYGKDSAQAFVGDVESFLCTLMLIGGYGVSALPFAYLCSRKFNDHSSAQVGVLGIFFVTGFVSLSVQIIMISTGKTEIADFFLPLFRLWPAFNLGNGLIKLSGSYFISDILGKDVRPFDWEVAGLSIVLLWGLSIPYSILVLFLEYTEDGGSGGWIGRGIRSVRNSINRLLLRWHGVRRAPEGNLMLDDGLDNLEEEDADVLEERYNIRNNKENLKDSTAILLADLWKVYPASQGVMTFLINSTKNFFQFLFRCCCNPIGKPIDSSCLPKRALRGLSTAIVEGETFGLLGMNGAGKSTTLNILTGDTTPTSGEAYVAGHDVTGRVLGGVSNARRHIGFCPQVDPLLDLMTGRETLYMFGRLRGIPARNLRDTVNRITDALALTPHADKPSESYSGGNKRKLSLGVALIGNPDVLFIDEASSGMDPFARKKIWELISKVSENRSVVLTSHSMEEVEALCTRVTIMVSGRMRCLGSVQYLKSTYLGGYTVDLQIRQKAFVDQVESLKKYVTETALPSASLVEQHSKFLKFSIPSISRNQGSSLGLGDIFGVLETLKKDCNIIVEDYAISQCTLEQVFIAFAKSGDGSICAGDSTVLER
mmetsp:Transcript_43917/g.64517  ORF Transcript_43917/g.64517 Transcript_43917/m.64517 type:complete len:2436 (+) Transcript_43917:98-7405(+)|eukprot:CAMPEP_0195512650 /NCGR_PEP_ID=MMETSP0794_2-20130614/4536_1 /TAXON_ID=515487 /ORGANISM="Stephanopyxis turris, Strain CCMP 815" /LENGTH=2435 /DNA_ID=CAMNT_0040640485 /DNA_START=95 /DNA_END=7402 /DNA_ORIENTATION=-